MESVYSGHSSDSPISVLTSYSSISLVAICRNTAYIQCFIRVDEFLAQYSVLSALDLAVSHSLHVHLARTKMHEALNCKS